ncbi:hypothetical protein FHG68_18970 [Leptospira weilii]|nr:hypothetical protein FHG67_18915 [Leptospira weilii]QDK28505.1 hypothetical protein FHG68_18970 [Leptospira weilii]
MGRTISIENKNVFVVSGPEYYLSLQNRAPKVLRLNVGVVLKSTVLYFIRISKLTKQRSEYFNRNFSRGVKVKNAIFSRRSFVQVSGDLSTDSFFFPI